MRQIQQLKKSQWFKKLQGLWQKWRPLLRNDRDKLWTLIWLGGLLALWLWNLFFLNDPARGRLEAAFFNTLLIGFLAVMVALLLAWFLTMALHYSRHYLHGWLYIPINFAANLLRSIPQILGVLFGYVFVNRMLQGDGLSQVTIVLLMAAFVGLFVFMELADLMLERIAHFQRTDFYNAMRVCNVPEWRIINIDILWKNGWIHIFNKLIALFGMTIFLLCSVDFIISVGLSTEVSSVNLPETLGSMLARIDSKQDILAIGRTLSNPLYLPQLFFRHLQGISVAFLIVFSLLCIYKISDGFGRRYHI